MSGRYLSVQSCYVAPGSPAQHAAALKKWNPISHRELKVFLHSDLPSSPSPADFSRLKNAPDNSLVRGLADAAPQTQASAPAMTSILRMGLDKAVDRIFSNPENFRAV